MKLAESLPAAKGTLKMVHVMQVDRIVSILAIFLVCPIGTVVAAGWEDGTVVQNSTDTSDAVLGHPDLSTDAATGDTTQGFLGTQPFQGPAGFQGDLPLTEAASAACPNECHNAAWAFRSDALLLWRNAPASRPLYSNVIPGSTTLGSTALNANDLNSDVLAAPRLSLFRTNRDGHTFEATYFYAGNFYSERSLPYSPDGYATSPPGIYGNEWGPPSTSLDSATAKLLGQLQSVEFNTRHCIWADTLQFLMGARWLQWNESLQMQDFFSKEGNSGAITGSDLYETRCFNNLWGGQIGLDALLLGGQGAFRVEGLVKAGAYYNAASQASSFQYYQSNGFAYDNQARANEPGACAFVGELGLTAVVPISCNCDFRFGYFGLWLTNLAQPTRQLSNQTINQFTSVAGLDTSGSVILQGLSLGLEGRW